MPPGRPSTRARACSGWAIPGGPALDRLARDGDKTAFGFPVARVPGLDFSFSGVKTALLYAVRDLGEDAEERKSDLAASYQHAVVRALVERTLEAAEQTGAEQIAVVGGVAANSELRASLAGARFAPLELCTDNAAMVASAGRYVAAVPYPGYLALDAIRLPGGCVSRPRSQRSRSWRWRPGCSSSSLSAHTAG